MGSITSAVTPIKQAGLEFAYPVLPACDALAASLTLHHVADMGAMTALFGRIAQALRPGRVFINADVTMPGADPDRVADYATWAAHLVACGID